MTVFFYLAAAVAVLSTFMVITRANAVHALLYLVVSLLSVALVFFLLGAPFVAALEVIIYAGAIIVLFVFVVMILNIDPHEVKQESEWLRPETWVGPSILTAVLMVELISLLAVHGGQSSPVIMIGPKQVGISLLGPYLLGVELASLLLLAGLVGAYHLGRGTAGGEGTKP
jgi:NADH-quinone oxidoreductase subunit J